MELNDWCKEEIRIACEAETDPYATAVYNSAAKAYASLCEDGHSGMSIGFTRNILNRLIDGKPLKPLTGADSEWEERGRCEPTDDYVTYQNRRCSAVFKDVYDDGRVEYHDNNRFTCEDISNGSRWHSGSVLNAVKDLFPPIGMPYMPSDEPIVIYMEDFLLDENNGDFDHKGIFYAISPDGTRTEINIYLKEVDGEMTPISKEEYIANRKNRVIR